MKTKLKWDNVSKYLLWGVVVALFMALVQFEKVNYLTTYNSLAAIFGRSEWIEILSQAVVITDLAALAYVFIPQRGNKQPVIVQTLLSLWVLVSTLDIALTWYFAAVEMETTVVVAPAAIHEFVPLFPFVVAALIWGVQAGLLYMFGKMLEGAIGITVTPKTTAHQRVVTAHHP